MDLRKKLLWVTVALVVSLASASSAAAFGAKEIEKEKAAVKFAREVLRGSYGIVTTDELKQWQDAKKEMLIIDTMPLAASFVKNHIPQAVQSEFPIPEMTEMTDEAKAAFIRLLGKDKSRTLVFYCGFTKCSRSHNGAMWAVKLGYENVYRCPGGIKGWIENKYPVAKGE